MSAPTLSCPYCNTAFAPAGSLQPGQRIRCPRCHELLPISDGGEGRTLAKLPGFAGAEGWTNQGNSLDRFTPKRWSNRSLASMILLAMVVMASIGLLFAWFTTEQRRKHDRSLADAGLLRAIAVKPERLAALAYLPGDMSIVGGVHVAELMADDRSRELLLQLRANQPFRLEDLERAGLKLETIDHIVFGARLEPAIPPPAVLVIRTREAYDADKMRAALKARPVEPRTNRALSRIQLGENSPFLILWCADDHTLVMSFQARDLPGSVASPSPDSKGYAAHFAPVLQKHLEAMGEGTPDWIVGATDKLQKTLEEMPFIPVPTEYRRNLGLISSFAGSIQTDDDIEWRLVIDGTNANAAKTLDTYLARQGIGDGKVPRWFANWPGSERLASELSKSLARKTEGERVLIEARSSFSALQEALVTPR